MKTQITSTTTERDPRWTAVVARDAKADGTFYYSVRTTGVYCRPSCGARRPRPENVRFHRTMADAERAGFRPCRRCRPDGASIAAVRAARITAICRAIEAADEMPTLAALAKQAGLSVHHFHREFTAITGVTPRAYAEARRTDRIRGELVKKGARVTDAIYAAGFGSDGRFYESSDERLGMTPTAYRAGGAGMAIEFAVGTCSLGAILVARSTRGLCAILLGSDPDALVRDLQDRFPRATFAGGRRAFDAIVARVVAAVETPSMGIDLPLDVRGTAFQRRVWQAIRQIPAGATASYAEIAAQVGAPAASRAVARACASNALAVAIPCHRVVRTDGSASGYRWGVERKRELLRRETTPATARPRRSSGVA